MDLDEVWYFLDLNFQFEQFPPLFSPPEFSGGFSWHLCFPPSATHDIMVPWCFQAPKKYPTCNEFFHQRETSKMSVQGWKAPFMAIVICLDTLIFLKILSTFVDGVVGQMTIDICQMLLEHGSIKAKDSLLYVSWGGAPHRMPVATRHPKVLRFQGYIGQFPRFNRWDNYPTNTFWRIFQIQ